MGDIIWYNDLISSLQCSDLRKKSQNDVEDTTLIFQESADALFSCETYEVVELTSNGPGLIFSAYGGLSIEFKTNSYSPGDSMTLICDEWCYLVCKRIKENQSAGQEMPFSLLTALYEGYFSDVVIKSTDNHQVRSCFYMTICSNICFNLFLLQFHVHSPILRLNGFDCSINNYHHNNNQSTPTSSTTFCSTPFNKSTEVESNQIRISISSHRHINKSQNDLPNLSSPNPSSSNFLIPPALDMFNFSPRLVNNISSSFNCLTTTKESDIVDFPKKYPTSSSDSNLQVTKNIFNFSHSLLLAPIEVPIPKKILTSPYRVRSPSPFPSLIDTPPSSPLTPVSILYNLPSFMLSPILHWLYADCLPHSLDEETLEKLISIGESQPPLNKLVDPCRKYLRNIKIKKCKFEF